MAGQGIEAIVVAKGPFDAQVGRIGPSLDDDVRFSGNPQVLRCGLGQGKTSATEDACELILRQVVRQGGNGGEDQLRRATKADGYGHFQAGCSVVRAVLVDLPMQSSFF